MRTTKRVVSDADAKTGAEAELFLFEDSGRVVFPVAGSARKIEGGWEIDAWSLDGRPRAMDNDPMPDLPRLDFVVNEEPVGWEPRNFPGPDAGKERNGRRERFRVMSISGDRATVAYCRDDFRITVPTSDLKSAQPGEDIEGVVVGMGEGLRDVFIIGRERLVEIFPGFERVPYKGAPSEEKGWAPFNNPLKPAGKE